MLQAKRAVGMFVYWETSADKAPEWKYYLSQQVERGGPPGGAPVSPGGARLPAQLDGGDAEPHGPPGQSHGSPPRARQAPAPPVPTTAAAAGL